jgi:hypothetical protein
MTTKPFGAHSGIFKEQLDVIEHFGADYSLNVENLPKAPLKPGQRSLCREEES